MLEVFPRYATGICGARERNEELTVTATVQYNDSYSSVLYVSENVTHWQDQRSAADVVNFVLLLYPLRPLVFSITWSHFISLFGA